MMIKLFALQWIEMGTRAGRQAKRIASRFTNLSAILVGMAFYVRYSRPFNLFSVHHWGYPQFYPFGSGVYS
jgi:hypothetical protein